MDLTLHLERDGAFAGALHSYAIPDVLRQAGRRLRDSADNVQLVVLRGTTQTTISVKPVEARSEFDSVSSMADPAKNLVAELGIIGVEIDARIAGMASGLRDPVRRHRRRTCGRRDRR